MEAENKQTIIVLSVGVAGRDHLEPEGERIRVALKPARPRQRFAATFGFAMGAKRTTQRPERRSRQNVRSVAALAWSIADMEPDPTTNMTFGAVNFDYRTGRFHRKVDGLVGLLWINKTV